MTTRTKIIIAAAIAAAVAFYFWRRRQAADAKPAPTGPATYPQADAPTSQLDTPTAGKPLESAISITNAINATA
jgi:hypothetical protein